MDIDRINQLIQRLVQIKNEQEASGGGASWDGGQPRLVTTQIDITNVDEQGRELDE